MDYKMHSKAKKNIYCSILNMYVERRRNIDKMENSIVFLAKQSVSINHNHFNTIGLYISIYLLFKKSRHLLWLRVMFSILLMFNNAKLRVWKTSLTILIIEFNRHQRLHQHIVFQEYLRNIDPSPIFTQSTPNNHRIPSS